MPFVTKKDRMISRSALATTFAAAFCVASLTLAGRLGAADAAHVKEVEAWRAKHEADYRKEYVPLAGLFSLKPGANTAGSGPSNDIVLPKSAPASIGRFVLPEQRHQVRAAGRRVVTLKGQRRHLVRRTALRRTAPRPADELSIGDITLWVHESGDTPRHPHARSAWRGGPLVPGFRWFPIDEHYRVTGRFIKDPAPRELHVPNQLGDEEPIHDRRRRRVHAGRPDGSAAPHDDAAERFWFIFP